MLEQHQEGQHVGRLFSRPVASAVTVLLGVHATTFKAEVRRSFNTMTVHNLNSIPGHTIRAPPVGFQLQTNSIQLYVIQVANLDKTSLNIVRILPSSWATSGRATLLPD